MPQIPPLSHRALRIRKIRSLTLWGWRWRWRTEWERNGQIGVWSEHYVDERDCDASIKAHQSYLDLADVITIDHKTGSSSSRRYLGPGR